MKLMARRKPKVDTAPTPVGPPRPTRPEDTIPIAECVWRRRARVAGRVRSMRVHPWAGQIATLECALMDDTGGVQLIFLGRRQVAGVKLGARIVAEGTMVERGGHLAMLNPVYDLLLD